MDFLQRHLPRVYQAVQSALVYLTNVTAQVFGAPPNAPQPRNAKAHVPIKTPLQSATPQETSGAQVTDQTTSPPHICSDDSIVGATGQNGEKLGIPLGNAENQRQETAVRHQKGCSGGRLDLEHKISEDKYMLSDLHATMEQHEDLENTAHSYKEEVMDDLKQMESEDIKHSSQRVTSPTHHAEGYPLFNLDINKENQGSLTYQEHIIFQHEKNHEDSEHMADPYSNSTQEIENICPQPNALNVLTGEVDKEQSVTYEERSEEREEAISHMNVTSQSQELADDGQVSELSMDINASPVTVDYDNELNVSDINYPEQHKKLVTPANEADASPYEARKTWEDLQETAIRLALQCDLVEKDSQECEKLEYVTEMTESVHVGQLHLNLTNDQGYSREDLVNMSLLQDLREVKGPGIEEGPMTEQFLLSEHRSSGEHCSGQEHLDLLMEDEQMQTKPSTEEQAHEESNFPINGAEGNIQCTKQESSPNFSKIEKTKRRVHFSPSTENLIKKLDYPSTDTALLKADYKLEGALQQTNEYIGHQTISHSIIDSSQSLNKKGDDDYLEDNNCIQDNEPSICDPMSAERENPLQIVSTVWYDEAEVKTEGDDGLCESLVDIVYQNEFVNCQVEETFMSVTERSLESHSYDLSSCEETNENKNEPANNTDASIRDFGVTELSVENVNKSCNFPAEISHSEDVFLLASHQTADAWISNESDYSLEKENSNSDHYGLEVSDFSDYSTSINIEDMGLSIDNTEIKVDYSPLEAMTEPLIQKVHKEDTHAEGIVINEELLRTCNDLSQEDCGSFGENKDIDGSATAQLRSYGNVDNFQTEPYGAGESPLGMFSSEAEEDLLKSLQEDDKFKNFQFHENGSLGQQVSLDSNDNHEESHQRIYESLKEPSTEETDTSIIEKAEDLASEEISEDLSEFNVPAVSDSEMVTYTCEGEEQLHYLPEDTNGNQNLFSCHEENLKPETSISHEDGREIENGHLEERSVIATEASQEVEHQDFLEDYKANYQNDTQDTCNKDNKDHSEICEESLGELDQLSYKESEIEDLSMDDQVVDHQIDVYHTDIDKKVDDSDGENLKPETSISHEDGREIENGHLEERSVIATEASQEVEQKDFLEDYKANYQNDTQDTCNKDNKDHSEICEESLGELDQLSYKESEIEDLSMDDQVVDHQIDVYHTDIDKKVDDSDGDLSAKVKEMEIVSGDESISTSRTCDPQAATGSDSGSEVFGRSQDVQLNNSEQSATKIMGELDVGSEHQSKQDTKSGGSHHEVTNLDVSFITKVDLENVPGAALGSDIETDEVSECEVPLDLLSEIQCVPISDHTVCKDPSMIKNLDPPGENQLAVTLDVPLGGYSEDQHAGITNEVDIASESGFLAKGHTENIEDILGNASDTNSIAVEISESLGVLDLLSETESLTTTSHPAINLDELGEGVKDEIDILEGTDPCHKTVHSTEADGADLLLEIAIAGELVDTEENAQAVSHLEELGSSLEPHEEYEDKVKQHDSSSTTVMTETPVEEDNIELGVISSSKEKEIVIKDHFGSEDTEQSEIKSFTEFDLLSEIQTVITTSYPAEVARSVQPESDEIMEAEVDILKRAEPYQTMVHSSNGDKDNILSVVTMSDVPMDAGETAQAMSHSEELGSSLGLHQEFEDKVQHDSSSANVVTETYVEESNFGLGTINTIKDIAIVITTNLFESENKEQSEIKLLPEVDDIRPEMKEKAEQQESTSHKTFLIHSDQTEQGITGPSMREEHLQMIQPSSHTEISEDQERPLVAQKEIIDDPAMQEEDDMDGDMLPHNMLDVSAQRSRVQLRRKTSIRRRQGQPQVVPELEPAVPPRPSFRPLSMGVSMFPPGALPIFSPTPTKTPHATEEHVEEKPATEDLTVKPKKVIPKHAGFGMPSPQMMQELQARLKKKKPKE